VVIKGSATWLIIRVVRNIVMQNFNSREPYLGTPELI
jgi:hypothetical protein